MAWSRGNKLKRRLQLVEADCAGHGVLSEPLGGASSSHQRSSILKVTGRQRRPVQFVSRGVLRRPVYPTGANPSFADGTHSNWYDVTEKTSVSNWLKTPNVCASVFCGPKIS
jgi:hypothetical protein